MALRQRRWPSNLPRALGAAPEIAADGTMTLGGYRIPARVPNTLALNFEGGHDIPTFSLADLRACAEKGDAEYFRRYFDGKVVLFGTVLDVEDRHITSKRFATAPGAEGARMPRCVLPVASSGGNFVRDSISGVYGHATAVNNLIRREALIEFGRLGSGVAGAAVSAFAALAALLLAPIAATMAYITLGAFWAAAAVAAFRHAIVLPLVDPLAVGFVALAVTIGYRFVVADRDKRFLRKSFALYLAPAVIERDDGVGKSPRAGWRNPRDHGVFFRRRRLFLVLGEDDPGAVGGADERISLGDDRHHRAARRLRRQVYRRCDRRRVRRPAG